MFVGEHVQKGSDGLVWALAAVFLWSTVTVSAQSNGTQEVPYFPAASDALRQGFVRVINHSDVDGTVMIRAFDDAGEAYGPLTLSLGTNETVHFNSDDLEDGNDGKGLSGATGAGTGNWRLRLESDLDFEVLAYLRTSDGFLTSMHDVVAPTDGVHRVAIFNPASNANQVSWLRVANVGDAAGRISVAGVDDEGTERGSVELTLDAGAARTLSSQDLEGGHGVEGALGDGSGKWRLNVTSDVSVRVMSLLASPTGHLTNLSAVPRRRGAGEAYEVPLFPPADHRTQQGFLRVINHEDRDVTVRVEALDDSGAAYGPVSFSIRPGAVVHFNSDDWETGNPAKGIVGVGSGAGTWRLQLTSEDDIEVLSYIRTTDGFLTSMLAPAAAATVRHRIPVFNPGSNVNQVSRLRLVNPNEAPAAVTITGVDDEGMSPGTEVDLSLSALAARSLTAQELESGSGDGLDGALGDGTGKWQLVVTSDVPVQTMSLLASATGHLTDLSSAPNREALGAAWKGSTVGAWNDPLLEIEASSIEGPEGMTVSGYAPIRLGFWSWARPAREAAPVPPFADIDNGIFVGAQLIGHEDFPISPAILSYEIYEVADPPSAVGLDEGWNYRENARGERHGLQIRVSQGAVAEVAFYVDGVIRSDADYENGNPDGFFKNYTNGELDGVNYKIYRDDGRDVWEFATFKADPEGVHGSCPDSSYGTCALPHGRTGRYENGNPDGFFKNYTNGELDGVNYKIYRDDGRDVWEFHTFKADPEGVHGSCPDSSYGTCAALPHGRTGRYENGNPDGFFKNYTNGELDGVNYKIYRDDGRDVWEFHTFKADPEGVHGSCPDSSYGTCAALPHGRTGRYENGNPDGFFKNYTNGELDGVNYKIYRDDGRDVWEFHTFKADPEGVHGSCPDSSYGTCALPHGRTGRYENGLKDGWFGQYTNGDRSGTWIRYTDGEEKERTSY